MTEPTARRSDCSETRWEHWARAWLTEFIADLADRQVDRLGFGWTVSRGAAQDYDGITAAFMRSIVTGTPLPIPEPESMSSIYLRPDASEGASFTRLVTHVGHELRFGFFEQLRVAKGLLDAASDAGAPEGSLPWILLRTHMVGRILVEAMTGCNELEDELGFAQCGMESGLPFAVLAAVQHRRGRPICSGDTEVLKRLMECEL